jgi:hypothetical protein
MITNKEMCIKWKK